MRFEIELSPDAQGQLEALNKSDQIRILNSIETQLRHEPLRSTRHRKVMRSNLIASRELRVGDFRVYYDVDEPSNTVLLRAIGIKRGNRLYIAGEEVDLS